MQALEVVLGLMVAVAVGQTVARRLEVPAPVLFVVGGAAVGLVPGVPAVPLAPEVVFLLFLPPLLYWQAFNSPLRDFRLNARSIGLLSIGLVLATTVVVAAVAHAAVPDLPWGAAFVLGAIVAPPDAVAAAAVGERLRLPRNVIAVLEGESLLNDATALVAYRVALTALVVGTFSLRDAFFQFLVAAAGGIAIGVIVGWLVEQVRRRLEDPPVENTLSLLTGFAAYLPAEQVGVSGVLAAVATGFYLSRPAPRIISGATRLRAQAMWEMVAFLLNGMIFILIGLQLPAILLALTDYHPLQLVGWALAVSLAAMAVRLVWVFPGAYLPRWLDHRFGRPTPYPPWQHLLVIGWSGMRGVVSLAAALALPIVTAAGAPLPGRSLIVYLTFALILATLVGQGLTLPWLIRRLGVAAAPAERHEEGLARTAAVRAALARLDEVAAAEWAPPEAVAHLREHFEARLRAVGGLSRGGASPALRRRIEGERRLRWEVLQAEREAVIRLRDEGAVGDDTLYHVLRDLDLDESRLAP